MDRSVAQTLNGLIPTLTGPVPPELIELAVSLLAQSRSKASSLKADEEIARSYACANIACERLKQTLSLPQIQPRPPCPPKVYQQLYKYLDGALPIGRRRSTRPSRQGDIVSAPASSPAKPRTPAKAGSLRSDISRRKAPRKTAAADLETPAWVMPVIRQLCRRLSTPAAPHHVFAGVSSILSSSRDTASASPSNETKTAALIVAVFLLVTTRLAGVKANEEEFERQKSLALEVLNESAREGVERTHVGNDDVDGCMKEIRDRQWTQMDWFGNVPVGAGVGADDGLEDDADHAPSGGDVQEGHLLPEELGNLGRLESLSYEYLQAGLGTMMQDRVDYLSDDRRRDFQKWKKSILIQIDEMQNGEEMDLEAGRSRHIDSA